MGNRYSRQIAFEKIGEKGQSLFFSSSVCVIGVGALGGVSSNELARAGIGKLRIIDRDYVELSNLQRQSVYTEDDVKENLTKVEAAARFLRKANSEIEIDPIFADVNPNNIEQFIEGMDVVIDASDNFALRFLLNEACDKKGIPWVYGGVLAALGASMTIIPGITPCFRCFSPELIQEGAYHTTATKGVISPITAVIASIQVAEAMKILVDFDNISNKYVQVDLWNTSFDSLEIKKNPDCPICGQKKYELLAIDK